MILYYRMMSLWLKKNNNRIVILQCRMCWRFGYRLWKQILDDRYKCNVAIPNSNVLEDVGGLFNEVTILFTNTTVVDNKRLTSISTTYYPTFNIRDDTKNSIN